MRLDLVIGPNGSGKSTFVQFTLAPAVPISVFVNAGEIARREWPQDPEGHSYEAARIAATTRSTLIQRREPFIAETVFSHPSKLDLITEAHNAGYTVALHTLLIPEDLAVARVAERVSNGGHSVPEDKIRERWRRLWPHVVTALGLVDTAVIYDNSHRDGPREIARYSGGALIGSSQWPAWTPPALTADS